MITIAQSIMNRVRSSGRAGQVYTPRDFLDLGSRAAIDQALSRLVKQGALRRVARGLYDRPRRSAILDRPAPPILDAVVDALRRRGNLSIVGSDLAAANALGLTHAVPTRPHYVAARKLGDVTVGGRTLRFSQARAALRPWLDSPAAPVLQALLWLRDSRLDPDKALATLRKNASPRAKSALAQGLTRLPGWAVPLARQVTGNRGMEPG
jgi:hypothetical protein